MAIKLPPVPIQDKEFSSGWQDWLMALRQHVSGATATVTLAKLTTDGTNGTLTIENGIIKSYTAPT